MSDDEVKKKQIIKCAKDYVWLQYENLGKKGEVGM
jgi:hypothetical protein